MWQVGLGKVRPVALRFVGNGQGKAGWVELDPVAPDPVGNGKSRRGLVRQVWSVRELSGRNGAVLYGVFWCGKAGMASSGRERIV